MKSVILTGIDSTGKSTIAKHITKTFKNTFLRKYPHDEEIKRHINSYYQRLVNGGKELHEDTITNMYRQIHDLYDRDFRMSFSVPEGTKLILFDRYFIDNIVHSRMNAVEKQFYGENHFVVPDLVILLRADNYKEYKKTFTIKGDENIREPAILFHEVGPTFSQVLKELQDTKRIKRYTIISALKPNTTAEVTEKIKELLFSS
jgi:thymidylate kinase